ncbi:MAG: hypothetical protein KatS3mg130_0713 [Candidatus Sumerlaea sp.]|uniref:Tetratricopeptide repeat-like domain-containing protein n=1 Tax=Sumerlaea chitinivorans TaxID=2250252 RepID=A0A2Z4Y4T0_SUMC1|nr:hypothetical protein BRCON_0955 [Candidatus Sumerlaea chitinivorans]GIX44305.1 MAG: hypothetical protein KatS3mg130_0713 [Candidatus Sumerlaea sp.]
MPGMSKQELKHDELSDLFDRIGLWYHRNAKWIQYLVIAVVLAFLGFRLYDRYLETERAKATAEIGKVADTLQSALRETDEAKRKVLFATAIADAERVAKEYSGQYLGRQAQLLLGNAHYYYALALANQKSEASEERKKAREAYERYISIAKTNEERAAGKLALGNVFENELFATQDMNYLKQAEDAYRDAIRLAPNTFLAAEAKLALARMYQPVTGKKDEAERLLSEIQKERAPASQSSEKNAATKEAAKETGRKGLSQEKIHELREFSGLSYAKEAERLLTALQGFEPEKKQ